MVEILRPTKTVKNDGRDELRCSVYIETTWGSSSGEWGDPVQEAALRHDVFPPPAFDNDGNLYISDFINQRLLEYNNSNSLPTALHLPKAYFDSPFPLPYTKPHTAIEITMNNILVPYGENKLGILHLDGTEDKTIELPYKHHILYSPHTLVLVDDRGGLIVNGERYAYFDVGWKDGQWNEISSTLGPQQGLFLWDDVIGYSTLAGTQVVLSIIDPSGNFLDDLYSQSTIKLPETGGDVLGVDDTGDLYFKIWNPVTPTYIRYSLHSTQSQVGFISNIPDEQIIRSTISPDGAIYLIVYDREDITVQPKIVKCHFPDER